MAKLLTYRNEDAPFYFEKQLAALDFIDLLDDKNPLLRVHIKPDRKYGKDRRIDDLTRFYDDKSVEVVQIKHSQHAHSTLGFSDLWKQRPVTKSETKEGVNVFKFLKSWRSHRKSGYNTVTLTFLTNKNLTKTAEGFFSDTKKLKKNQISWRDFSKKYSNEIADIKANCDQKPFISQKELREFVSALNYQKTDNINDLHNTVTAKLKTCGITNATKVDAFINRVTRTFISDTVNVLPADVLVLIDHVKTGLLQEVAVPDNYVPRPELEQKIQAAIDTKKKTGGFVFLFSPSGSGKTILLSQMSEQNPDFLPYFCRIRPLDMIEGETGYLNKNVLVVVGLRWILFSDAMSLALSKRR